MITRTAAIDGCRPFSCQRDRVGRCRVLAERRESCSRRYYVSTFRVFGVGARFAVQPAADEVSAFQVGSSSVRMKDFLTFAESDKPRAVAFSAGAAQLKKSSTRTVGDVVVTVASARAAVVLLIVGSPFVGRVGSDSAFAGKSLARTVQDTTVVCTVPELHGKSDFYLVYTPNFTGPSTYPASLSMSNAKTGLAWILTATFQNQEKGVFVDPKRCRHTSAAVPLSHAGLPGPPDQLHAFTCKARGQLLIRARAVWDRRGVAASIAVRSYATRKPVAFGFINHTGFGGLYTSRGCVPNS
jgi:hypothetical protein